MDNIVYTKKHLNRCTIWCLILYIFFQSSNALSFSNQEMTEEQTNALMNEWKPLEVSGDAIPWDVFAKTTENEDCTTDKDGFDICLIKPGYSEDIKKYDGKKVTLMGFMFPLESTKKQKNFLIGPYPLSCPFHYHIGPSQVVEVLAEKPVEFSYDPVTVSGVLKLTFNEETNMFYYLENAR